MNHQQLAFGMEVDGTFTIVTIDLECGRNLTVVTHGDIGKPAVIPGLLRQNVTVTPDQFDPVLQIALFRRRPERIGHLIRTDFGIA